MTQSDPTISEVNHKKIENRPKILTPLHPSLEGRIIDSEKCYTYGMETGISPHVIAAVVTGRARPNEYMMKRLSSIFSEEELNGLYSDYNPYRGWEITKEDHDTNLFYLDNYRYAGLIKPGDHIRIDDGSWLVVSKVIETDRKVNIFSGGIFCANLYQDDILITYVRRDEFKPEDKFNREEKKAQELESSNYDSDDDSDIINRTKIFEKILEETRKSSE